ncbi:MULTISPECIES: heme-binding protein [unclassified Marinobacterium]|jgi:glc operon protein GlcG|uniref:GlcG/HbpS family heme-binding protein n=1 Tax=unclassified Marinobacterium TaxID=2644139 RepID=UPI0015691564|nr:MULTISPECIES: heme-binding protein [unclassified Marinobacterium]NRP09993.1 hypothetical protein [Marinobacterium sp. xm-g-48]NRP16594.1 hypothetical protein [Marinobacterium sp. xm-a-152]NRP26987.1 hypothetical protein [Marinobacterium sp. xm-d-420]NRP36435.1 hypothetical protein [Marinobacterium sp. xm-d-579]NRP39170.1 hypothetical protein [Marinobacterium sp. xm-a-121]
MFESVRSLTMEAALELAKTVQAEADTQGFAMNVVVVDRSGLPLVVLRNPKAPDASLEFAERKAYTAASYGWPTAKWQEIVGERPLVMQGLAQNPKVSLIAGGLPVKLGDETIGGLGVAGAKAPEDHAVAAAGLEAFLEKP